MSVLKEKLAPSAELLYRQVSPSPSWVNDGRVTSVAFTPWEKDQGLLSVSCGSRTTAECCYDHYTKNLGLQSVGVWAVTTDEAKAVGLDSYWSPVEPPDPRPPDPAHGSIDFRGRDEKTAKTLAKSLAKKAHARGRQYPPLEQGQSVAPLPPPATPAEQPAKP
ncbi:hypothetical protein ACN28E_47620 [Archangium lansingense]|uniref:hypothetical protein n=1 Tax=Archangium lansingense TaxID=2995310 RepID=UPI003B767077